MRIVVQAAPGEQFCGLNPSHPGGFLELSAGETGIAERTAAGERALRVGVLIVPPDPDDRAADGDAGRPAEGPLPDQPAKTAWPRRKRVMPAPSGAAERGAS